MMSNTKQQIREMISDFGEDSISYGEELHTGRVKSDDEIKSDSAELLRKQTEIVEAIDRLVAEARIEENNRMQVEKLNLSKLTTDHAEGYNMCATDSNFRIHNRIAELQSQLTNKDTK